MNISEFLSATTPGYVYRLYSDNGSLLYIGCTWNVARRVRAHKRNSRFGHLIASHDAVWYPIRDEALVAEREAIAAERPPFNKRMDHAR